MFKFELCEQIIIIGTIIDQIYNSILSKRTRLARWGAGLFPSQFKFPTSGWMLKAATK